MSGNPIEPSLGQRLVSLNWQPSDRQLRQFGWLTFLLLPLAGWLIAGRPSISAWRPTTAMVMAMLFSIGALAAALATIGPRTLRPAFVALCVLALPIGWVIGEIVVALIYYAVFTPVALAFRLIGRDALERSIDRAATSYWHPKQPPAGPARYFRQF